MEGQAPAPGSVHQALHAPPVQPALRRQATDDEAVGPSGGQAGNLQLHQLDFLRGVEKVSKAGTHEAPNGNIRSLADLLQKGHIWRQSSHQ